MNIKGMTCGGCESSVSKALMEQDGVFKVVSIDHKSGMATVCFDPTKVESDKLIKLVTKKGFKAEVVAAVADGEAAHKGCPGLIKAEKTDKESN
ncbi:MAG: heavy-metal-associated domain-containing protein [candidate division Zixibacteria bacterium]|nr:heavy-metal-associated domain-containing protein [candidate division Zixibacteria bacterium]